VSVSPFQTALRRAGVDQRLNYYIHSYVRIRNSTMGSVTVNKGHQNEDPPTASTAVTVFQNAAPPYCTVPWTTEKRKIEGWVSEELRVKCHPTSGLPPCDRSRKYAVPVPCQDQLVDALVEDYAAASRWCDYRSETASIPPLTSIPSAAQQMFQKPSLSSSVRFAFFVIYRHDAAMLTRLFDRVYSPRHYYLIHKDWGRRMSPEETRTVTALTGRGGNVFVCSELAAREGSSSSSVLLARAMAWFTRHATGWDYLVSLTGQDYPLMPLSRIEAVVSQQKAREAMPYLMVWSEEWKTSRREATQGEVYLRGRTITEGPTLRAVESLVRERMGYNERGVYSAMFGPVLTCGTSTSSTHLTHRLDNRRNISSTDPAHFDSQWLFPRSFSSNKLLGFATTNKNPVASAPTADGIHRVWVRSDPATTALYDRDTVEYIAGSEEGRKYYHFFKYSLANTEEYYIGSLLYNWERTSAFVSSVEAVSSWSTWAPEGGGGGGGGGNKGRAAHPSEATKGVTSDMSGGADDLSVDSQSPEASFVKTPTVLRRLHHVDQLIGLSDAGVFFARKFHSAYSKLLLDAVDAKVFLPNSTTTSYS